MENRLDIYLVEHALAQSRERAKALVMAGIVYVNDVKADKPGEKVPSGAVVEVRGKGLQYVSRGGLKLEKAMKEFSLYLEGLTCMDVGASTGGFTDCMLQNGAKKVYAVDVGYGQLAWTLRNDPRVINLERTNIRNVTMENIGERIDFFTVDVSFISLKHIFPVLKMLSAETCSGVILIKPQFEAGKEKVGKKGVVREKETHIEVINNCIQYAKESGFFFHKLDYSPIKGPEGNIEFIALVSNEATNSKMDKEYINVVVEKAHSEL